MNTLIPAIERQTEEEIKVFQEEKLRELVRYLNEKSIFYQKLFKEHHICVDDIRTLADLMICSVRMMLLDVFLKQQ